MLTKLKELIDRHAELSALHDSPECEIPLQTIDKEQDDITDAVFALVRDNLRGLAIVQKTLENVQSIIESTYGHETNEDGTDGARDDSEPEFSSADIVEFIGEIEGIVDEAVAVLGEAFESSRPVHVIVAYDEPSGYEAIYKDGELFDSDLTMYASDVARAIGEANANISSVDVELPTVIEWPKRFEDLMKYIVDED